MFMYNKILYKRKFAVDTRALIHEALSRPHIAHASLLQWMETSEDLKKKKWEKCKRFVCVCV